MTCNDNDDGSGLRKLLSPCELDSCHSEFSFRLFFSRSNVNRNLLEVFQQNKTKTKIAILIANTGLRFFNANIYDLLIASCCSFLDSEQ